MVFQISAIIALIVASFSYYNAMRDFVHGVTLVRLWSRLGMKITEPDKAQQTTPHNHL